MLQRLFWVLAGHSTQWEYWWGVDVRVCGGMQKDAKGQLFAKGQFFDRVSRPQTMKGMHGGRAHFPPKAAQKSKMENKHNNLGFSPPIDK